MRVFVSSSFEDLREHRAAAIRVLRTLGHEVLAMEDMTAGSIAPLPKVLDMVDRSEAYVGIFAWRYGYVPAAPSPAAMPPLPPLPPVAGAIPGKTSITHYEYLRAVERKLPILAFLLGRIDLGAPEGEVDTRFYELQEVENPCANPTCVSRTETRHVKALFRLASRFPIRAYCGYCSQEFYAPWIGCTTSGHYHERDSAAARKIRPEHIPKVHCTLGVLGPAVAQHASDH